MPLPCQNYDLLFILWIFKQNLYLVFKLMTPMYLPGLKKKEPFCTIHVIVTFL